ncbi:uncharacterized protein LOC109595616 [Aethina tumida]|uniref:uncharacterized protein LOC109595616 n=1 Tax=Aethina tumida TaxID=116153 RepID=UPI0021497CC5|nr:uncharacterized protein LOC109595616 [Aethina tumida]
MGSENVASGIPWMDDVPAQSTSLPEILEEETNEIGTVVIFVISAVITIALLFMVAIFIDCRQQKLVDAELEHRKRRIRIRVPKLKKPRDDEDTLTDRMEQPSSSNDIV